MDRIINMDDPTIVELLEFKNPFYPQPQSEGGVIELAFRVCEVAELVEQDAKCYHCDGKADFIVGEYLSSKKIFWVSSWCLEHFLEVFSVEDFPAPVAHNAVHYIYEKYGPEKTYEFVKKGSEDFYCVGGLRWICSICGEIISINAQIPDSWGGWEIIEEWEWKAKMEHAFRHAPEPDE